MVFLFEPLFTSSSEIRYLELRGLIIQASMGFLRASLRLKSSIETIRGTPEVL